MSVATLLASANSSGQCTAFTMLLLYAAWANGVSCQSSVVTAGNSIDNERDWFLVKNWLFTTNSRPEWWPYEFQMIFASTNLDMVAGQGSSTNYGDMLSVVGLSGQNVVTPSQKVFKLHQLVRYTGGTSPVYYDPSYGRVFTNAGQFEGEAVSAFLTREHERDDNLPGATNLILRVRPKTPGAITIQFNP